MGAPLPSVPNVLKVVLKGFIDAAQKEIWANVLHFAFGGSAPTNGSLATIAQGIATNWGNWMAAEAPSPTNLAEVQVTDLTSPTAAEGTWTGFTPGTRGDDSIPANSAVLISYPSQLRYRGGHPRQYLYVLGNADLNGAEEWSTAGAAEVLTHWHTFLNSVIAQAVGGMSINGFVAVRYHGKYLPNSGAPHYYLNTPLVIPIDLNLMTSDTHIASQKRRIGREEGGFPEVLKAGRMTLVRAQELAPAT